MRKSLLMVGIPVSVLGLGLAAVVAMRPASKKTDAFAAELEQADAVGMQLAQAQSAKQFALSETVPEAKPEAKTVTKRGAGPKAVRSKSPTVKAAPEAVAADVVEEIPDLSTVQTSAGPTHVETPVASSPAPAPETYPAPSQDQGPILRGGSGAGNGRNGGGTGIGSVMGGIFGAVIRGGGVDGDNCDPRGARGGRAQTGAGSGTYGRNPNGMGGIRVGTPTWGGATAVGNGATNGGTAARPRGRQ